MVTQVVLEVEECLISVLLLAAEVVKLLADVLNLVVEEEVAEHPRIVPPNVYDGSEDLLLLHRSDESLVRVGVDVDSKRPRLHDARDLAFDFAEMHAVSAQNHLAEELASRAKNALLSGEYGDRLLTLVRVVTNIFIEKLRFLRGAALSMEVVTEIANLVAAHVLSAISALPLLQVDRGSWVVPIVLVHPDLC